MQDLEFAFDPVCPFSWLTSRWVEEVRGPRALRITWRPIALWFVNEGQDPDTPRARMHDVGLRLQRVTMAAADEHGEQVIGPLYRGFGSAIWDAAPPPRGGFEPVQETVSEQRPDVEGILSELGMPPELAAAQDDPSFDERLRRSTEEALEHAGGDVGTPILRFGNASRPAYSGPILSTPVRGQDAVELWDAVTTLVLSDAFAELRTNRRGTPEVPLMGNAAA